MCGRYALYDTDILNNRFGVEIGEEINPNYNAAPTQTMPVITRDGHIKSGVICMFCAAPLDLTDSLSHSKYPPTAASSDDEANSNSQGGERV